MKSIIKFKPYIQFVFIILTIFGIFQSLLWTINALFIISILSGSTHCGYICPFGTIQEWLNKLGKRLSIRQIAMPMKLHKFLKFLRYLLLLLFLLLNMEFLFHLMKIDVRANFNTLLLRETITVFSLITLVVFSLISLKFNRFFCNYFCIEGAKHGFISIFRPITIHKQNTCISCRKCDISCPMQIEISSQSIIKDPSCINCFDCIKVCPIQDTLVYKQTELTSKNIIYYVIPIIIIAFLIVGPSVLADLQNKENHHLTPETQISMDVADKIDDSLQITDAKKITTMYKDGLYSGKARGFRNYIEVEVQIQADEILEIQVIEQHEDYKWYRRAVTIIDIILNKQSTDVDLISGATYSSRGIRDAVKDAMEKAKMNSD